MNIISALFGNIWIVLLVIVPLIILSIMSVAVIFERLRFWTSVLKQEKEVANRILDASRRDWGAAAEIARQAYDQPIGRVLYAPLRLEQPDPELFCLALEASADEEVAAMRRGDKLLEAVIAMAPLLGLLGTIIGLITSLSAIDIGKISTEATKNVTSGIGESLVSTAAGLLIALLSLSFYRLFQGFVFNQAKILRRAGNEMELLYRQKWQRDQRDPAQ
jgi:biopolymer transport protein ExbB